MPEFIESLTSKVFEQMYSQHVGYLLGAGASYLDGNGYPLASSLWESIRDSVPDGPHKTEIQSKIDNPQVGGIEPALDLLDGGGPVEGEHRHIVAKAIADYFRTLNPPLETHISFVNRLASKGIPHLKIFSLNYDTLIERAAEESRVRLSDGFNGHEHAFFDAALFEERNFRIRGTYRGLQTDETSKPLQLFKLHGSVGWYFSDESGVRRCGFSQPIPVGTKHLMIPPQKRKANDTMMQPYQALWSAFRGALGQDRKPLNRLACLGYGFTDEHLNTLIETTLSRTDFTVLIFSKHLTDVAWSRWSEKRNVIIVTEDRSSLYGQIGSGHTDLWKFEYLSERI